MLNDKLASVLWITPVLVGTLKIKGSVLESLVFFSSRQARMRRNSEFQILSSSPFQFFLTTAKFSKKIYCIQRDPLQFFDNCNK